MKFFSIASLGLLLVVATAFPLSELQREDGENSVTRNKPTWASSGKTAGQISYLIKEVFEMRKELCKNDETCIKSRVSVSENNLNLPKMTEKDGCFQTGYTGQLPCANHLWASGVSGLPEVHPKQISGRQ
ncbi:Hypothetical predicted protein [Marmota monax]|uniref:Interleukin-6 n=1 Tax=Marmota monax TaxID=9995 RepID=A0A5E4ASK1_MARMO|nr:hypothetical protein GHT09_005893 [Marmota monax]VTJ59726.1 Hypothetical predicted protein [Marmota monax]